jgi:hypothetical protein
VGGTRRMVRNPYGTGDYPNENGTRTRTRTCTRSFRPNQEKSRKNRAGRCVARGRKGREPGWRVVVASRAEEEMIRKSNEECARCTG